MGTLMSNCSIFIVKTTYFMKLTPILYYILFACCLLCPFKSQGETIDKRLAEADSLFNNNQYNKALSIYQKYIISDPEKKDKSTLIDAYIKAGNIYTIYTDYSRAHHFYQKAWSICKTTNDPKLRVSCFTRIIGSFCDMNQLDSARIYNERLRLLPLSDNGLRNYFYTFNCGYIAEASGDEKSMVKFMEKTLAIIDTYKLDENWKLFSYANIYPYFEKEHDYGNALKYLTLYYDIALRQNRKFVVLDCYKGFMRLYSKIGDSKKSLYYQEKYFNETDTVLNVTDFNAQKNAFENYEKEIEAAKRVEMEKSGRMKTAMIFCFAILAIMAIVFDIIFFRQRRKLNTAYTILYDQHKHLLEANNNKTAPKEPITEKAEYCENPPEKTIKLISRIKEVMEDENIFCDPSFSLSTLAKLTESNTLYVSQAINSSYEMNFRSYLNECRVKVVMRRLLDNDKYGNYSLKGIAESAGFNSQASFIAAFKKVAGMPPNVYRKMVLSDQTPSQSKSGT